MSLWSNSVFPVLDTGTYNSKYIWCGSDISFHHAAMLCRIMYCNRRIHWSDKLPALITMYGNRCAFSQTGQLLVHPEVCKQKPLLQKNCRRACFVFPLLGWFYSTSPHLTSVICSWFPQHYLIRSAWVSVCS